MSIDTSTFPASILDIRCAAEYLAPVAVRTPLPESPYLNEIAGRRVLIKAEVLQRTGSFKFRGAWTAISALDDVVRKRGVIAYSSGNHAQGIAHAASLYGVPSVIVMPADSPALKLANTQALGASVVTYDRTGGESREAVGEALAAERGLTLIRPYDEPMVIAGQGTVGLEIAEQAAAAGVSEADVLVCCGGPVLQQLAGPGLTVDDKAVLIAMGQALMRLRLVVEPGGAVALAAALVPADVQTRRQSDAVICVVTGGNVDPQLVSAAAATFLP